MLIPLRLSAAHFMHDVFLPLYDARERYREGQNPRAWLYTTPPIISLRTIIGRATKPRPLEGLIDNSCDIEVEPRFALLHDALREVLNPPAPRSRPRSSPCTSARGTHHTADSTNRPPLPEGTVKSRLHKTMNIIKQQLKKYEDR